VKHLLITHVGIAFISSIAIAQAQSVENSPYFKGRSINIYVGGTPGASYDTNGRLLSRHMGRYIPGAPTFVVQNLIGAGGIRMVNFLHTQAAKDGAQLGMIPNTLPALQAVGGRGVQFDLAQFRWIGSISPVSVTLSAWRGRGIDSWEDARKREVVAAASAKGAITYTVPALTNAVLGTKFRIVTGYQGLADISLALERGEAEVVLSSVENWKVTKPDWWNEKRVLMFIQAEPKSAEIPSVPSIQELTSNDDDRRLADFVLAGSKLGFPMAAGPGGPPEATNQLRKAFTATMNDASFRTEAAKMLLDINPVSWEDLTKVVTEVLTAPKSLVDRARPIISE
jgi:tripartite-type tricarboxylate transporter receptor subunit TctC